MIPAYLIYMLYMDSSIQEYTKLIDNAILQTSFGKQPHELYEPIRYILSLGGKRLRPTLVLMAYALFKEEKNLQSVIHPALAVEVFHNFTLMHDDIMDKAPLRRGKPTVHHQWNENIAILSGDVMMIKVYELLMDVPPQKLRPVLEAFNRCATEVCEGQQWDMIFETSTQVNEKVYLDMIRQKTAVLLGFSLQLGGILADAPPDSCQKLYEFGENIGIGFQLKDDLLDVYAEQSKFGKQVGGDIIANKKTFLLIKAREVVEGQLKAELEHWLTIHDFDKQHKVNAVKSIYDQLNIRALTEKKMNEYFEAGFTSLHELPIEEDRKSLLKAFTEKLIDREK